MAFITVIYLGEHPAPQSDSYTHSQAANVTVPW